MDMQKMLETYKIWEGLTLETVLDEARKNINGTSFMAIRPQNGPRQAIVFCFTGEHELRAAIGLASHNLHRRCKFGNWQTIGLWEAVGRATQSGGFCFDEKRDESGNVVALIFAASGPESIKWLEEIMMMPP
jgi:hypothetical protein